MPDTCDRCGRERAESLLEWNMAEHARFMAAPEGADSPEELGPAPTCARLIPGPGRTTQNTQWDCDRATIGKQRARIAKLERENAELRADVVALGVCRECRGDHRILDCADCSGTGLVERARKWRAT